MNVRHELTDVFMKGMNLVHRSMLAVSGGRLGNSFGSMPAVKLHTIGRKSGKERTTMLTAPIVEDGTYVLIASKGGDDRDPDWYRNLLAQPDIQLTIDGETSKFTARVASDEEKDELWPRVVKAYKGYGQYQERTERNIPVVICEPA